MASHVLVVGGTGMLGACSLAMADRADALTSMARTQDSLAALDARLSQAHCVHHPIAVDYNDHSAFQEALARSVDTAGPIDLAIGWFHDDDAAMVLADAVGGLAHPVRFIHVLGSTAVRPAGSLDAMKQDIERHGPITCQQVVLGFIREAGGSRWLTHDEICHGVIGALDSHRASTVVGTIEPWNARPRPIR